MQNGKGKRKILLFFLSTSGGVLKRWRQSASVRARMHTLIIHGETVSRLGLILLTHSDAVNILIVDKIRTWINSTV